MRKVMQLALVSVFLMSTFPVNAFATDASIPNAVVAPSPKAARSPLTQTQKAALAAARSTFAAAKADAQAGFDRARADAQAIRDQAIAAAGQDKNAIKTAKKNFKDSYRVIMDAYKSDISEAKAIFQASLAAANIPSYIQK